MVDHSTEAHTHAGTEVAPAQTKVIWKTFIILSCLTGVEFLIAFTLKPSPLKVAIFVGMTIVKAFYIVGEFMHLKHEVKGLIWAILLPVIFVCWLLLAMLMEGGSIFQLR